MCNIDNDAAGVPCVLCVMMVGMVANFDNLRRGKIRGSNQSTVCLKCLGGQTKLITEVKIGELRANKVQII